MKVSTDFLIIGAGIVGISIAREIKIRNPKASISILEKEPVLSESAFLWAHHQDAMAVEKLAEGIRSFAVDQGKLETMLLARL